MRIRSVAGALALLAGLILVPATPADAQFGDRITDAAKRAAEQETARQVQKAVRNAIRCVVGDIECFERGEESGEQVVFVDEDGNVITDEDGDPITDPEQARATASGSSTSSSSSSAPGEGVWANYDFVPGDEILFYDDYTDDAVGDFPRRMNFVRGNWDVVEWREDRFLRHTGQRYSAVEIPLPRTLPDRFTVEFDVHMPHGNHGMGLATYSPAEQGGDSRKIAGNFFHVGNIKGVGVTTPDKGGVEAVTRLRRLMDEVVSIRIMVDGRYAKVYADSKRVANVPNAELRRSGTLYLENLYGTKDPIYIGPIRVAAGGGDLYDDLLDDGRATTRGLLFDVNSDRLRPESTPTLQAIGRMLQEHPDLRLRMEGHTDADGEEAHNRALSERRAASVKSYLVERNGIDASRLEAVGLGESQPVADNRSAEGKQKNRRVELVRLGG